MQTRPERAAARPAERAPASVNCLHFSMFVRHTCHILPPADIDLGLCLAVFAGSGGKHLFHRIG